MAHLGIRVYYAKDHGACMVQTVDMAVMRFVGTLTRAAPGLHRFLCEYVANNDLLKGGLLVALLWWFWAQRHPDQERRRALVLASVAGSLTAAFLSRSFAWLLPFRERPFELVALELSVPLRSTWEVKGGSFPSDHMALAFGIVAGIFLIHRWLGVAVGVYVLAFVGIPRVLLAIHWPSDIVGGALLGIAATLVFAVPRVRGSLVRPVLRWHERAPHVAHAAMFLVSFGLMTRFDDVRGLCGLGGRLAIELVRKVTTVALLAAP